MSRDASKHCTEGQTGAAEELPRAPARRSEISSFIVMDVMRAAATAEAQGRSIIHMEVGQPGTPAPKAAREAVAKALDNETLGYTMALGIDSLRARITQHYRESCGVTVAPERVVVTSGSSAAFVLTFLALFDAGERVGLPSPGYPCYRHILTALGIGSSVIETGPETRWMPSVERLSEVFERDGIAGLLIASPANPTGTMLTPDRLAAIARFCKERKIWFISDEIYHGLTYGAPAETALRYSAEAIVINSFSKYYSMTGWRVGWMVVPQGLVRTVERLAQNLYISPAAASQVAALAAFDATDETEANRAAYAANREFLLSALPSCGFDKLAPADGAFYIYADVSRYTSDSLAFARQMLDEAGVAVTPGVDFDELRGGRFLRFSYAGTLSDMSEGIRRLKGWARLAAK
jgi:aspartate/methionine/tyrosine aminotransferase